MRVVDIAAAKIILEEAGGVLCSLRGEPLNASLTPTSRVSFIAASSKDLARKLLEKLAI